MEILNNHRAFLFFSRELFPIFIDILIHEWFSGQEVFKVLQESTANILALLKYFSIQTLLLMRAISAQLVSTNWIQVPRLIRNAFTVTYNQAMKKISTWAFSKLQHLDVPYLRTSAEHMGLSHYGPLFQHRFQWFFWPVEQAEENWSPVKL